MYGTLNSISRTGHDPIIGIKTDEMRLLNEPLFYGVRLNLTIKRKIPIDSLCHGFTPHHP